MWSFQRCDDAADTLAGSERVHQIQNQPFDVSASCPRHT
jgi:hypothetical protein